MFGVGPMELVVIVVVALLIFGPQKLPELARTIGKGLAEFRRASNDLRQTLALDELQGDLRKTMTDATRMPASRPAQAGDTLPPGSAAAATAAATASAAATPAPDPGASTPPWKAHPGELPEGIDHEHREAATTPTDPPATSPASPPATPATPPPATPPAAIDPRRSGDPELGNVPVAGGDLPDPRRG